MKLTITKGEYCTILNALELYKEIQHDGGDQRAGDRAQALTAKLMEATDVFEGQVTEGSSCPMSVGAVARAVRNRQERLARESSRRSKKGA